MLKLMGKKNNYNFTLIKFPYLDLCGGEAVEGNAGETKIMILS